MSLRGIRLGVASLLLLAIALAAAPLAQAQDEATLANTANSAMQRMANSLSAALAASSSTEALADVNAAISAGQEAVAALQTLVNIATNDVVRSRSKAALDQTSSAVNKAQVASGLTGDAFRSQVEAALAEVNEAIVEFAPVLQLVPSAAPAPAPAPVTTLPRTGSLALDGRASAGLAVLGLIVALAGLGLRRRQASLA